MRPQPGRAPARGRNVRPLIARTLAAHRDAVEDACARLRWCAASVEALDFDDALRRARELLGFRATAAVGTPWTWLAGFATPALAGREPASRGRAHAATMLGAGSFGAMEREED